MRKFFFIATVPGFFDFFEKQIKKISKDFNVTLISGGDIVRLKKIAQRENAKYEYIHIKRKISIFSDIKTLYLYYKYFKKEKPIVVHGNTPKGALLSMLASFLVKVPNRIYMCHGLRFEGSKGLKKWILIFMEKICCLCSTHVICVSFGVKEKLVNLRLLSESKATIIGNGSANGVNTGFFNKKNVCDDEVLRISKKFNIKRESFIFIFIGRLVKDKGVFELFEAFKKLQKDYENISLLYVGPIDTSDSCYVRLSEMSINNNSVIFTGQQEDIRPFIFMSKVLVLPSYREGFGMVLAESASMEIPVIASDIIGCNNVVIENINGLFCQPKDVDSLYLSMRKILINEDLYQEIVLNTRKSIKSRFDHKVVVEKYLNFYKTLKF